MSVGRKVLRKMKKKMKKAMLVIGAIPVLTACSSQISRAAVNMAFDASTGTLCFSGAGGKINGLWMVFYNPDSIRCVVIENGIKKIGEYAFCNCTSLEEITIPNSVNIIGESAFRNCTSLKKITIPNSVNTIGEYAFRNCTSLKKITIPNSVNTIGEYAFWRCSNLERVVFKAARMGLCNENSFMNFRVCRNAFGLCKKLALFDTGNRIAYVDKYVFYECDPNFLALEGRTVRGEFYNSIFYGYYNYFIPHEFLVDKSKYWGC